VIWVIGLAVYAGIAVAVLVVVAHLLRREAMRDGPRHLAEVCTLDDLIGGGP
jgi:hypothetical protein